MGQKIDLTRQVQGILPETNGGAGPNIGQRFSDAEVPSGTINGSNVTFTLAHAPNPALSLLLFLVGTGSRLLQIQGIDYTLSGSTITMSVAPTSSPAESLISWYRYLTFNLALSFSEGLVLSDAVSVDAPAARLPLGMVDQIILADFLKFTMGPIVFMDQLLMSDSFSFTLGVPLTLTDSKFPTMGDAFAKTLA
jgi:hypothetical protein